MNMHYVALNAKAIAGWVAGIIVTALLSLVNGTTPWPQTKEAWISYLVASFGTALVVWAGPANKISDKQIEKDPTVVRVPAPPAEPPAEGEHYDNPWLKDS